MIMLKSKLSIMPPAYVGKMTGEYASNGWYPVYTQVVSVADNGRVSLCSGKLMYRYSDDFCGAIEVRSVTTIRETPRYSKQWGWEGSVWGCYVTECAGIQDMTTPLDMYKVACVHRVPDSEDLAELCIGSLAAAVLAIAGESQRSGIIARDRLDSDTGCAELLEQVTRMGNWTDWSADSYTYDTRGNPVRKWNNRYGTSDYTRKLKSIDFFNFNSDREVGVFVSCIEDGECGEYPSFYRDYAHVNDSMSSAVNNLAEYCPTQEWCVG
jgi:hypothetical protein